MGNVKKLVRIIFIPLIGRRFPGAGETTARIRQLGTDPLRQWAFIIVSRNNLDSSLIFLRKHPLRAVSSFLRTSVTLTVPG